MRDRSGSRLPHSREFVQKANEKFNEECTFKPKINDKGKHAVDTNKNDRWKVLTEPNRDK